MIVKNWNPFVTNSIRRYLEHALVSRTSTLKEFNSSGTSTSTPYPSVTLNRSQSLNSPFILSPLSVFLQIPYSPVTFPSTSFY